MKIKKVLTIGVSFVSMFFTMHLIMLCVDIKKENDAFENRACAGSHQSAKDTQNCPKLSLYQHK